MAFFDKKIKIIAIIILLVIGIYFYNKYYLKEYFVVDTKIIKPVGEINLSFADSFQDAWNKSSTYHYKAIMRDGYV